MTNGVNTFTYTKLSYAKGEIDPDLWDAIHAVRKVGGIGAHMYNNVDHKIDSSSNEAILLVRLIETLFKEWYEARAKKNRSTAALLDLVGSKRQQQNKAKAAMKSSVEAIVLPDGPESTDA